MWLGKWVCKKTTFNIIQGVQEKCHIQIYRIICMYISYLGMLNVAQCATQIFLWFLRKFSIRPDLIFAPCLTSRLTMDYWQSAKQGKDRKSEKFFSANKIEELALMDQSQVRKLEIRSSLQKEATWWDVDSRYQLCQFLIKVVLICFMSRSRNTWVIDWLINEKN